MTNLEDDVQLRVEVRLETFSLQDRLKLVQELERVLDGGDVLETLIYKCLRIEKRNALSDAE